MRNLTLLTDFYELTMMYGYYKCNMADKVSVFDVFYRGTGGYSYAIAAGLEQVVEYIQNLHFDRSDIEYLRSLDTFDEDFLRELSKLSFTGSIRAVPEGTMIFPQEPILTVKARLFEAQLIETALLTMINHQTLIATKAARLCECTNANIMEFGLRRAHGPDAGIYGARAAYIGGCRSTSNCLSGKMFDIAIKGTHAHSWVMSFPDELTAFREYAKIYPDGCMLLVDTFNTLKSGVPNAIKVFDELKAKGHKPVGIRLDSGDIAYLSKQARKMLDDAGYTECVICASGDIDEDILLALDSQKAKIDVYGIGTKLITSFKNPSLGGVYKMSAIEDDNGNMVPKMKISNTAEKNTNPGEKKLLRLYDRETNMALADLICLHDDVIDDTKPLTIFDPVETWKKTTLTSFKAVDLMRDIFKDGALVYTIPDLSETGEYCDESKGAFYPEYRRVINTQDYKVDLSDNLYNLKTKLLHNLT